MTIQSARTWRARAICDDCGWRGDWRTSTDSPGEAGAKAGQMLDEHRDFWHPAPEPTDDEIRSACPNPAIDPDRIREQLRTEALP